MKNRVAIYALHDPRTEAVRYVGRTKNPKSRAQAHFSAPCSLGLKAWADELRALNLRPRLEVLCWVLPCEEGAMERRMVLMFERDGCDLLNKEHQYLDEPRKTYGVALTERQSDAARAYGDGSRSRGVRRLIERYAMD